MSSRVHLMDPEIRANPYPLFARLRREAPVSQVDPGGLWAVARHEDVMHVLKNPRLFSSEGFRQAYRPAWISDYPLGDSMLVMDPPYHTRLRALVNRDFTASAIARLEPEARQIARRAVQQLPAGREVDFVQAFSTPLPLGVLGGLLGLAPELHPLLRSCVERLATFTGIEPHQTERQQALRASVDELRGHFERIVEERRREPGDDLMSDLLRARVDGEALSSAELMGFVFLLLVAGMETTMHLLSHAALRLRLEPELMTRLREQPSLLPRFIDELLRHEPPAQGVLRLTTAELELGGVWLPQGARVLLLMGSANRDEAYVPEPDRFDLERPGPQNLPFGYGAHFCLGAQLARFEARLALEALLARFARLRPGTGPVSWNSSLVVRGPTSLPLVADLE